MNERKFVTTQPAARVGSALGEIERLHVVGLFTPGDRRSAHPARRALNRLRILFPQNALPTRASNYIVQCFLTIR